MAEDEKKETPDPSVTPKKEEKAEEKPTLETMNAKLDEIIKENERLKKQNADKDSHISRTENENKDLREKVAKVIPLLEGKTEKQKDAILDRQRQKFLDQGYDEKSVDLILETIEVVADGKAQTKIVPLIMEFAQELVESDSEIEPGFMENNQSAITEEYNSYKPEISPRKIKANLKKAYNKIKDDLTRKAKVEGKGEEDKKREDMLKGGASTPPGGRNEPQGEKEFIDSIAKAGTPNSHFI